jgi:hypothetical protein
VSAEAKNGETMRKKKPTIRGLNSQSALIRDLKEQKKALSNAGVLKERLSSRMTTYGELSMLVLLRNAYAEIDRAILLAQRGKLVRPAYILGVLSSLAVAINDKPFIVWAATKERGGIITAKVF